MLPLSVFDLPNHLTMTNEVDDAVRKALRYIAGGESEEALKIIKSFIEADCTTRIQLATYQKFAVYILGGISSLEPKFVEDCVVKSFSLYEEAYFIHTVRELATMQTNMPEQITNGGKLMGVKMIDIHPSLDQSVNEFTYTTKQWLHSAKEMLHILTQHYQCLTFDTDSSQSVYYGQRFDESQKGRSVVAYHVSSWFDQFEQSPGHEESFRFADSQISLNSNQDLKMKEGKDSLQDSFVNENQDQKAGSSCSDSLDTEWPIADAVLYQNSKRASKHIISRSNSHTSLLSMFMTDDDTDEIKGITLLNGNTNTARVVKFKPINQIAVPLYLCHISSSSNKDNPKCHTSRTSQRIVQSSKSLINCYEQIETEISPCIGKYQTDEEFLLESGIWKIW